MNKNLGYLIGVIVIVLIAAALLALPHGNGVQTTSSSGYNYGSGGVSSPILLTDPPQVPNGTTALTITYTSLAVQTSGTSGSGWVSAQGSGTLNLMTLINVSQVIGSANVPANSTVNMVRFNVSSATITVNGVTSNVTVPSGSVTAHIVGNGKANATTGMLLDFTPTVATIFTANSTVFVLVPSLRAVTVGNQSASLSSHIGEREDLNTSTENELERARANVSITATSLAVSGNTVSFSVTVKDNSNMSVDLRHVLLYGNESIFVIPTNSLNATVHVNASDEDSINAGLSTSANVGRGGGAGHMSSNTPNENESEHSAIAIGVEAEQLRVLNFQIGQNGALMLPSVSGENEQESIGGYNLTAGSSATFTFNGVVSFGGGRIIIAPVVNNAYKVSVSGEEDAMAKANVTAS